MTAKGKKDREDIDNTQHRIFGARKCKNQITADKRIWVCVSNLNKLKQTTTKNGKQILERHKIDYVM